MKFEDYHVGEVYEFTYIGLRKTYSGKTLIMMSDGEHDTFRVPAKSFQVEHEDWIPHTIRCKVKSKNPVDDAPFLDQIWSDVLRDRYPADSLPKKIKLTV